MASESKIEVIVNRKKRSGVITLTSDVTPITTASDDAVVASANETGGPVFELKTKVSNPKVEQRIKAFMDNKIPIPAEIKNLEDYLNDHEVPPLTDEQRQKYLPYVVDLVKILDASYIMKNIQPLMTELRRKHRCTPRYSDLIEIYRHEKKLGTIERNPYFERIIRKKFMRTASGVGTATLLLGPGKFSCPMDCHYCPNDPAIARSYLLDEPAVRRGFKHGWDPILQFDDCADRLYRNGHEVTKMEIIIEGGTFGSYPVEYIEGFFRDFFYAANTWNQRTREKLSLQEEIKLNETSECAIIGITIETRPDWINEKQIQWFRKLAVTRVQIGIQHIDDRILNYVNRQCPTWKTIKAIELLKVNCFKISAHFMPDLPGSCYEIDREMFEYLFSNQEDIQVDFMKVYPTMTVTYSKILEWYNEGSYKPYAQEDNGKKIDELMKYVSMNAPSQIRFERIGRDICNQYIHGGLNRINIRQEINDQLKDDGLAPRDIRGREVKGQSLDADTAKLHIKKYRSAGGDEFFISYENIDQTVLYGYVRLRLDPLDSKQDNVFFKCLKGSVAKIRELHVYGELVHQDHKNSGLQTQHLGIGRFLMSTAEQMAYDLGYRRSAVIAGVGVRRFYRKLGYELEDTYMLKDLIGEAATLAPHLVIQAKKETIVEPTTSIVAPIISSAPIAIISNVVHNENSHIMLLLLILFMIFNRVIMVYFWKV